MLAALIHTTVDYPLRSPALTVLFVMLFVWFWQDKVVRSSPSGRGLAD
jgi:hypothetical protein